jgi:hypothetical protein
MVIVRDNFLVGIFPSGDRLRDTREHLGSGMIERNVIRTNIFKRVVENPTTVDPGLPLRVGATCRPPCMT